MTKKTAILVSILLIACMIIPGTVRAKEEEARVVRVGWYESAFHRTDQFGRRSGYGYEYQQRIAIYTGWTYEYVEGSWSELLEMLIAGDLDLLSDVSYTPERAEKILYSSEAMGSEDYHIFIDPGNTEIRPDDFSTLNGKRVGVNKNSIQEQLFRIWAAEHQVEAEVIESTEKTPVLLDMLAKGEFDALVTLDTYGNTANVLPLCKVGYADSYFGISQSRPDLKRELDMAMNRLVEENREFNQQLTEKFNKAGSVSSFLSPEEREWLASHGTIRVGYRDGFLPFCDTDGETGQLTGALADYLDFAKTCLKNAVLHFEPRAFASVEEGLQALKNGEIDCMFPASLSTYDGEQMGIITTDPLVQSEMYVTVRTADHQGILPDRAYTVAIISQDPSYVSFVKDWFPAWHFITCPDSESVYQAVSSGQADCGLVSNYRISRHGDLLSKYSLSPLTTDRSMNLCFAVNRENDSLYSIFNKVTRLYPATVLNSSLTNYGFKDNKVGFLKFVQDNWVAFLATTAIIVIVILLLVLRNLRVTAREEEGRRIISETERDSLTHLYNWNFFVAYANRLYREHPDREMDAISVNISRFHAVNALHGHQYGNRVLRELAGQIEQALEGTNGIACRSYADLFMIYYPKGEDWQARLAAFQAHMDACFDKAIIHVRMGIKPWEKGLGPELQFDKARTASNVKRSDYRMPVIYDAAMAEREERDQRLLNDFPHALENQELEVYYQPKYDIRSDKPRLSSAEALVRWNHPELGKISPEEFIKLFEQSGQINLLDSYVWEKTARQIALWRDRDHIDLPVSVNLSRVDVFDPELQPRLDGIVERNGLKRGDLKLEVTESAYTENADQLIRVIEELRRKGYEIEMDDFGSGYSSLNMLSSLPVDVLKMDIAFIRNIEKDEKNIRLVELIIDIARFLKVPVVAEGVETENQMKLLKKAGCDLVQGYYFSAPLPEEEFRRRILRQSRAAAVGGRS